MKIGRGVGPKPQVSPQGPDSDSVSKAKSKLPLEISAEGIVLSPGEADSVDISQKGERLQILFNGQELMLSQQESAMLEIRGSLKGVNVDSDVKIPIRGMESQGAEKGKVSKGDSDLASARQSEASLSAGITQRMLIDGLKESTTTGSAGPPISEKTSQVPSGAAPSDTTELSRQGQQLSKAVTEGQPERMLNLIENGARVELLSTEQKMSAVKTMKEAIPHSGGLPQAERSRDALFRMVSSAQSPSEFRSVISGNLQAISNEGGAPDQTSAPAESGISTRPPGASDTGLKSIGLPNQPSVSTEGLALSSMMQELAKGGPDARTAMRAASMNIAAGAFGMSETALNPEQASTGERAVSMGFQPQEVLSARKDLVVANTGNGWTRPDVQRFASDPLSMAVASPEEKTSMIQTLSQGYPSGTDQRAFLSILGSSPNAGAFEMLVKSPPSQNMISRLTDSDAVRSFNLLAGGFGMSELATDIGAAMKSEGVLINKEAFARLGLRGGRELDVPLIPTPGEMISAPRVAENYLLKRLEAWAAMPETGAVAATVLENVVREGEGKPLLNPVSVRAELIRAIDFEAIVTPEMVRSAGSEGAVVPQLDPAGLAGLIQAVAGREGMSEFVMNQIVTEPFAALVGRLSDQAVVMHAAAGTVLEDRAWQIALRTGIDSRESELATGELEQLRTASARIQGRLSDIAATLQTAIPSAKDPVASMFHALEGVSFKGSDLGPVLPQRVPHPESLSRLPSLDVLPALHSMGRMTTPGSDLSWVVFGTAEAIQLPGALRHLPSAFQRLDRMDAATIAPELRTFVDHGKSFVESMLNGSYSNALNGLQEAFGASEDPSVRSVVTHARQGIGFLNSLQHGSWKALFSVFGRNLMSFSSAPPTVNISGPWMFSNMMQTVARSPHPMNTFMQEFPGWSHKELRQSLKEFRSAAVRFADTHSFHQAAEAVRSAREFVTQVRTGNLVRMLSPLSQMAADSPVVQDVLQRAFHLTTVGAAFIQPLLSRDWEKPLEQTMKKSPSNKGLREVGSIFNSVVQSFVPLSSVDYLDSLWRYQKPFDIIRDEVFVRSTIDRYLEAIPQA